MKNKTLPIFYFVICVSLALLAMISPSSIILARGTEPQLYNAKANPRTVHLGAQPAGNPLVISTEFKGLGGKLSTVTAELSRLPGAKYYDPIEDAIKDVDVNTPMYRVYKVNGEEAYWIDTYTTNTSIYRKYRRTLTHERFNGKEIPISTNRWQVELPYVGNIETSTRVRITATNVFNNQDPITLPLRVVDDSTPPEISVSVKYPISASAVRAGDKVIIKAKATDELSGVFSVRLAKEEARSIFGEDANLNFDRQDGSNEWEVENVVNTEAEPGTYTIKVIAVGRAGNKANKAVDIKLVQRISVFQIELKKGWNLISVPWKLVNPEVSKIFADLPIEAVRTVIGGKWLEVSKIKPGRGYLVKASKDMALEIELEDYKPSAIPPLIRLERGWNLVGYASPMLKPTMPLNFYLGKDLDSKWQVVYTQTGERASNWPRDPHIWATNGFPTVTGKPFSRNPLKNLPAIELGKGYWIYLAEGGVLTP